MIRLLKANSANLIFDVFLSSNDETEFLENRFKTAPKRHGNASSTLNSRSNSIVFIQFIFNISKRLFFSRSPFYSHANSYIHCFTMSEKMFTASTGKGACDVIRPLKEGVLGTRVRIQPKI